MFKFLGKGTWIIGAIISLFLMGCTTEPEKPLRVGTNLWPGYELLYLARDLDYFEKSPIRLVELSSATDVLRAFRNGILDVAALTLDETLTLLQTEPDLRVILVLDISNGADALLAKPSIKDIFALKGHRIAVENSAVGAIVMAHVLEVARLSTEDVEITTATVNNHYELYKQGKVDAVVTFDPMRTKLINEGANVLFDSSQISGQIVDVLVTRKELLMHRSKTLQVLVDGQLKALNYLRSHPQEAIKRIAPRLAITQDELAESYKGMVLPGLLANRKLVFGPTSPLQQTVNELVSMMLEKDLLYKEPQIDALISDAFIQ